MKYVCRSPTRIDFAGGTLDCWPLYLLGEDCVTVNLSVSIYTQAEIEVFSHPQIRIELSDLNYRREFADRESLLSCVDGELDLVRSQIKYWKPPLGFHLRTASESPVGGGLGGSSSLTISLLKVFAEWQKREFSEQQFVTLASNLEAKVLRKPTGTQDYFPALSPGLKAIFYTPEGARAQNLECDFELMAKSIVLVYTGRPHHSGLNNWQVIKSAIDGEKTTLQALEQLRQIGWATLQCCQSGEWFKLPELFRREYEARIRLSSGFSSPEIERLHQLVLPAGADAVKICGAGGGGCVFVWTQPERRAEVVSVCQRGGFQVLNAAPVRPDHAR